MRDGLWVFEVAVVILLRSCAWAESDPIALRIHAYLRGYDIDVESDIEFDSYSDSYPDIVGTIYFSSTIELIRLGKAGSVLRSCVWCPEDADLEPEIHFVESQAAYLRNLQGKSKDRPAHITYEFVLDGDECPYVVNHTNDECQTLYRSSGERMDAIGKCNLTEDYVEGAPVWHFLESCSNLTQKWVSVYQKLVHIHRIDNVYALFWEDHEKNDTRTTCILRSPAPFINTVTLSGPGLKDVSGSTYEGTDDIITVVYNQTHPGVKCSIDSPTGWTAAIPRVGERDEKISLTTRWSDDGNVDDDADDNADYYDGDDGADDSANDGTDAADTRAALLIVAAIGIVILFCICWIKRRDVLGKMVEMCDRSPRKDRHRYTRVS